MITKFLKTLVLQSFIIMWKEDCNHGKDTADKRTRTN